MSATMDSFDLILVIAAVLFHLSIVGVYIAQKKGRDKLVQSFGTITLLLGVPLAVVFGHYIISGEPLWKLISFGFIFIYLLTELLLDFLFKIDFRKMLVPHILYIILFYIAIIGFIRMSFAVSTTWGYAVSVAFWILLGALIYNLTGQRRAKSTRTG